MRICVFEKLVVTLNKPMLSHKKSLCYFSCNVKEASAKAAEVELTNSCDLIIRCFGIKTY